MVVLNIEAGRGIGDVKLGMTKEEVIQCILKYEAEYHRPEHMKNYFKNSFKVKYNSEGKVKLIEIPSDVNANLIIDHLVVHRS